jgi:hypothetical protein
MNKIFYKLISLPSIIPLFFVLLFLLSSCQKMMTMEYAKVNVQQASSYEFSCNKSGLIISVDPYIQKDRIDNVFKYDLLSKAILPLLVVFENKNAEDGYTLLTEQTKLILKHHKAEDTKDELDGELRMTETISNTYTDELALRLGLFLVTSPFIDGIIGAAFQTRRDQLVSIAQNISKKALTDKTVYPGGSHNGFLYLKFSKEEDIKFIDSILFNVRNIRTDDIQTIRVEMH